MAQVFGLTLDQVREQCAMMGVAVRGGENLLFTVGADRGRAVRVNLRVRDSHGPWARRAASGRHGPWACWHAFGVLYDRLFLAGATKVVSGPFTYRSAADNWQDWNCGSMVRPMMMSECCDCHPFGPSLVVLYLVQGV